MEGNVSNAIVTRDWMARVMVRGAQPEVEGGWLSWAIGAGAPNARGCLLPLQPKLLDQTFVERVVLGHDGAELVAFRVSVAHVLLVQRLAQARLVRRLGGCGAQ